MADIEPGVLLSKNRPLKPYFTAMPIPFLGAAQEIERPAGQEDLALSG
jgi:hypothetical protein